MLTCLKTDDFSLLGKKKLWTAVFISLHLSSHIYKIGITARPFTLFWGLELVRSAEHPAKHPESSEPSPAEPALRRSQGHAGNGKLVPGQQRRQSTEESEPSEKEQGAHPRGGVPAGNPSSPLGPPGDRVRPMAGGHKKLRPRANSYKTDFLKSRTCFWTFWTSFIHNWHYAKATQFITSNKTSHFIITLKQTVENNTDNEYTFQASDILFLFSPRFPVSGGFTSWKNMREKR